MRHLGDLLSMCALSVLCTAEGPKSDFAASGNMGRTSNRGDLLTNMTIYFQLSSHSYCHKEI